MEKVKSKRQIKIDHAIELIKPIFLKYKATNKENTLMKEEIIAEYDNKDEVEKAFKYLKDLNIIKKYKSKFYYEIENESKPSKIKKSSKILLIAIPTVLILITIILYIVENTLVETTTVQNKDMSFKVDRTWTNMSHYNIDSGWLYGKYISSVPDEEKIKNAVDSNTTLDYKDYPALINVQYDEEEKENDIDNVKEYMESYIKQKFQTDKFVIKKEKTDQGYDLLIMSINLQSQDTNEIEYILYVLNGKKIAYITATSYNENDADDLFVEAYSIANSFKWKK